MLLLGEILADGDSDGEVLLDGENDADGDKDRLLLADGLSDAETEELGESDNETELDGLMLVLGDTEEDGLSDGLFDEDGDTLALIDEDGLIEADILLEGETLGLADEDGETELLGETDALIELDGDKDADGLVINGAIETIIVVNPLLESFTLSFHVWVTLPAGVLPPLSPMAWKNPGVVLLAVTPLFANTLVREHIQKLTTHELSCTVVTESGNPVTPLIDPESPKLKLSGCTESAPV